METASDKPAAAPSARRRPGRRIWLFRLGAIFLALALFGAMELVCLLFDWGRPNDHHDPFVGFLDVHPLFVKDETGKSFEIAKSRRTFFAPDSFLADKPADGFRAFCLGGSTVQGRPFSRQTSFTSFLEISLQSADPGREWEIVNCGGISYASYRLVPILEECLAYRPDLFILCTGHNEFLEDRTYDHIKRAPPWLTAVHEFFSQSRSYTLLRSAIIRARTSEAASADDRPVLKDEVDALLDYQGGLQLYHRDEAWRAGVIAHYKSNVRRMIALARDAGVPVLLVKPCSNLSDSPPFKSEHRDGLTQPELERWEALVSQAREHYRNDVPRSIELLRQALEIDDQFAVTHYELGKCLEAQRMYESARRAFLKARETDICPLRILQPMEEALEEIAEDTGTPFLDAHALLERETPTGILGDYLLVDHVHPSFRGHQMIAQAIVQEFVEQGWLEPRPGWETDRDRAYRKHIDALDDMYYLRGRRALEGLQYWATGRADGPPVDQRHKPAKSIADRK